MRGRDHDRYLQRCGDFVLHEAIGHGAMGAVYKAMHDRHGAIVVKALRAAAPRGSDAARRFAREARALSAIRSRYVTGCFGLEEHEGASYLLLEWVRGGDLQARLATVPRLDVDTTLRLAIELSRGLGAVHAAGCVHRDLKPPNVLLTESRAGQAHRPRRGAAAPR